MSQFTSPTVYATDPVKALDYVLRRRADANKLLAEGLGRLRYVRVYTDAGKVVVGDVVCLTQACAVAYILARWW